MPHLSYACARDLRAEERANELLGTVGLVHVCGGTVVVDGRVVPCECPCGHPVLPTSVSRKVRGPA